MQLMWVSGPTGRVRKISITLRTVSIAVGILAALLVAAGGILHFVGLRIAIEARPDLARAMGGVLTQAEQDQIEQAYKDRLQAIQEKLKTTSDEIIQIQKLKDRFMDMATPSAVKSQVPGGNGKGGPHKLPEMKIQQGVSLIDALDNSLQDMTEFKKNVSEISVLWEKQLNWLNSFQRAFPSKITTA